MQDPGQQDALRETCVRLAQQGAQIARRMQSRDIPRRRKADASIVTEADTTVERTLIEVIRREFPEDAIIGEESLGTTRGADPATAERFWIIDPIDGTRSYARGLPWYCCCVAVADRHMPIAGAVVEAGTGMVFSAAAGRGAVRDGLPVRVRDDGFHKDAFVSIPSRNRLPVPETMTRWCNECVIRNYGTTALHLAMVAAGMLDAAVVLECSIWDIAAAGLIVLEAGGRFSDLHGRDVFPLDVAAQAVRPQPLGGLAAGPKCHGQLLAMLHA